MKSKGWDLLFHRELVEQLEILGAEVFKVDDVRVEQRDVDPNVRLFNMLSKLIFYEIPSDPSCPKYRDRSDLDSPMKDWRWARFGGRFRLYFRYDDLYEVIVYALVTDDVVEV
jgi:toxin YhaV